MHITLVDEKEQSEYCTIPKVHEPSVIEFQEHHYIENVMKVPEDRQNKVSVFKIPENIFNINIEYLKENISQTIVETIKKQTFVKIENVNNAYTYVAENFDFPEHDKSSPSGFRQKTTLAEYFKLVKTQYKDVFLKIENEKNVIDTRRETFSNFLNSTSPAGGLYAPDIKISFTNLIAKNIKNFDLTKTDKTLINKLSLDENHGTKRKKKSDNNIKVDGVHTPLVYLGSAGSCFPIYSKDSTLSCVNIHLAGFPIIWIFIKKESVCYFEDIAKSLLWQSGFTASCRNPIKHKILMINEDFLIERGIHYCKVIQKPGMVVITHPNGYHAGYSTGWNISEAVNFLVPYGIDHFLNSQHCGCSETMKLKFHESLVQHYRPKMFEKNQLVPDNPDDPEVIKRKKIEMKARCNKAREAYDRKLNMNPKPVLSDKWLHLYFSFIMDTGVQHLYLKTDQVQRCKEYLIEHGIPKNDEAFNYGIQKFANTLTKDISRNLNSIMERPYFQLPEQNDVIEFLNKKRRPKTKLRSEK